MLENRDGLLGIAGISISFLGFWGVVAAFSRLEKE
jgi:hypothetical protein